MWHSPANWVGDVLPGAQDSVIIPNSAGSRIKINGDVQIDRVYSQPALWFEGGRFQANRIDCDLGIELAGATIVGAVIGEDTSAAKVRDGTSARLENVTLERALTLGTNSTTPTTLEVSGRLTLMSYNVTLSYASILRFVDDGSHTALLNGSGKVLLDIGYAPYSPSIEISPAVTLTIGGSATLGSNQTVPLAIIGEVGTQTPTARLKVESGASIDFKNYGGTTIRCASVEVAGTISYSYSSQFFPGNHIIDGDLRVVGAGRVEQRVPLEVRGGLEIVGAGGGTRLMSTASLTVAGPFNSEGSIDSQVSLTSQGSIGLKGSTYIKGTLEADAGVRVGDAASLTYTGTTTINGRLVNNGSIVNDGKSVDYNGTMVNAVGGTFTQLSGTSDWEDGALINETGAVINRHGGEFKYYGYRNSGTVNVIGGSWSYRFDDPGAASNWNPIDNTGGTIVFDNAAVTLSGSWFRGGTIEMRNLGSIQTQRSSNTTFAASIGYDNLLEDVAIKGGVVTALSGRTLIRGTLTINADARFEDAQGTTVLDARTTGVTVGGSGMWRVQGYGVPSTNQGFAISGTGPAVFDSSVTLETTGSTTKIGAPDTPGTPSTLIVRGTIRVNHSSATDRTIIEAETFRHAGSLVEPRGRLDAGLRVTQVTASPSGISIGQLASITWTVQNNDLDRAASARWTDAVYLSSDLRWDPTDVLVGTLDHREALAANGSYMATLSKVLPPAPAGQAHFIVRPGLPRAGSASDSRITGNRGAAASSPIIVEVTLITFDTPVTSALSPQDPFDIFKLTLASREVGRLTITPSSAQSRSDVYVGYGRIPTPESYDRRVSAGSGATDAFVGGNPGNQVIYIRTDSTRTNARHDLTLRVSSDDPQITGIFPQVAPPRDNTTFTIDGMGLASGSVVELELPNGETRRAKRVTNAADRTLTATFDLSNAELGAATLKVTSRGVTVRGTQAINIQGGSIGQLRLTVQSPAQLAINRAATVWIEYQNTGATPIDAPMIMVTSNRAAILTADAGLSGRGFRVSSADQLPVGVNTSAITWAIGSAATPGIIQPGERGRVPVYYLGIVGNPDLSSIRFNAAVVTAADATPLPTATLREQVRPSWIDDAVWNVMFDRFAGHIIQPNTSRTVPTWGDLVAARADLIGLAAEHGEQVRELSIGRLIPLMVGRAADMGASIIDISNVDARVPGVGPALVFERRYDASTPGRLNEGPFGLGWTHNWDLSIDLVEQGWLAILNQGGRKTLYFRSNDASVYRSVTRSDTILRRGSDGSFNLDTGAGVARFESSANSWRFKKLTDTAGNSITAVYTTGGNLSSLSHSSGGQVMITYGNAGQSGRIVSIVESVQGVKTADDRTTTYAYDSSGRLLMSATLPGSRTYQYDYAPTNNDKTRGALTSVTLPTTQATRYEYDSLGRILATIRPGNARSTVAYSTLRGIAITDPAGRTSSYTIGLDDRVSVAQAGSARVALARTPEGRPAGIDTDTGVRGAIQYDASGRPTSITDPSGGITSFIYDPITGALGAMRDARGNETRYSFDHLGRLTLVRHADGGEEATTFNSNGQIARTLRQDGRTIDYTYAASGLVQSIDLSETAGVDARFEYNLRGEMTRAVELAAGTSTMVYDSDTGWLTSIRYGDGRGFDFTHDRLGRRTSRTDTSGIRTEYTYSPRGGLHEVIEVVGTTRTVLVTYGYDDLGRVTSQVNANGTRTLTSYNTSNLVTRVLNETTTGVLISIFDYAFDEAGHLVTRTSTTGSSVTTESFEYDDAGRVIRESVDGVERARYSFDAAGSRTSVHRDGSTTTYTSGARNEYTKVGSVSLENRNGIMTRDEQGISYTYDALGRITGASRQDMRIDYTNSFVAGRIATTTNGTRESYLIDPASDGGPAQVFNASGTLIATYDTGYGLISKRDASNNRSFFHFDAIGNTTELSGAGGAVQGTFRYDALGQTISSSGTSTPFMFAGRSGALTQSATSQVQMGARAYSPSLGRFTGPDPLELNGGSANFYTYAAGNPLQFVDSTGLFPFLPLMGVGAVTGAIINVGWTWVTTPASERTAGVLVGAAVSGAISGALAVAAPELAGGGLAVSNFLAGFAGSVVQDMVDGTSGTRWELLSDGLDGVVGGFTGGLVGKGFEKVFGKRGFGLGDFSDPRIVWDDTMTRLALRETLETVYVDSQSGGIAEYLQGVITDLGRDIYDAISDAAAGFSGPGGTNSAEGSSQIVRSFDPNDKTSSGVPTDPNNLYSTRIVQPGTAIDYRIRFENLSEADGVRLNRTIAPVQRIEIQDELPLELDPSTLEITEIVLGRVAGSDNLKINIPVSANKGDLSITRRIRVERHNDGQAVDIDVRVTTSLVKLNETDEFQTLIVVIEAIDPLTGWVPQDFNIGLMRPNIEDTADNRASASASQIGRGEGFIAFRIRPNAGLADGTAITNVASIKFDENEVIGTSGDDPATPDVTEARPATITIIDAAAPAASITSLTQADPGAAAINVSWSASDSVWLSQVRLYVRVDGGAWTPWGTASVSGTNGTGQSTYQGEFGRRYEFAASAIDLVANEDAAPSTADREITLVADHIPTLASSAIISAGAKGKPIDFTYERLIAALNVADADGDPIQLRLDAVSGAGTFLINGQPVAPGTTLLRSREILRWTPTKTGTQAQLTFTAVTSRAASANTGTVTVNLRAKNTAPKFSKLTLLGPADAGQPFTISLASIFGRVVDADNDAIHFLIDKLPPVGTLSLNGSVARIGDRLLSTDVLNFTPAANQSKDTVAFTLVASDGAAKSSPLAVKVRINAAPVVALQAKMKDIKVGLEGRPATLTFKQLQSALVLSDPNKDAISLRVEALGNGQLLINGAVATIGSTIRTSDRVSFTPAAAGRVRAFTVSATDGRLWSPARDLFVVAGANIAPSIAAQTAVKDIKNATAGQPIVISYAALTSALGIKDVNKDIVSIRIEALGDGSLTLNGQEVIPQETRLGPGASLVFTPRSAGRVLAMGIRATDGFLWSETRSLFVAAR